MPTNKTSGFEWYEGSGGHYIAKWSLPIRTNMFALIDEQHGAEYSDTKQDLYFTWVDHNGDERETVVHASTGDPTDTGKIKVFTERLDGEHDLDRSEQTSLKDTLRNAWIADIEAALDLDYEFISEDSDEIVFKSHGVTLTCPVGAPIPLGDERWVYHPVSDETPDHLRRSVEHQTRFSGADYYNPNDHYGDIVSSGESVAQAYDYAHHIPEKYRA